MMKRAIISGCQLLHQETWLKAYALVVEDGVIKAIIPNEMIEHHLPAQQYIFSEDYYLTPGFIDMHIHGANGKDVMDGNLAALHTISQSLAEEGVSGFLATTLSSDNARLVEVLESVATGMHTPSMQTLKGAKLLGIHLEGPFIAAAKVGAHDINAIALPQSALLENWQKSADGNIKMITLAPELPQATSLIDAARNLNMIVSIGHTNASYAETKAAIAAGATHATHLFNAMRGIHQREPGALTALLLSDDVNAELIVDGLHLHPAIVELAFRIKGKERLRLVTDAMRAKCLNDGQYQLGSHQVTVTQGKATLQDGTLAGSTLTMPAAIKNMVKFSKCSLIDAIKMATENPARELGLLKNKGRIDVHKDADLVVLNKDFKVVMTMIQGKEVFRLPLTCHP